MCSILGTHVTGRVHEYLRLGLHRWPVPVDSGGDVHDGRDLAGVVRESGAALITGLPFGPSTMIDPDGAVSAGGQSRLIGYTVMTADSLDEATATAGGCPQLGSGGSIEVYETFEVT